MMDEFLKLSDTALPIRTALQRSLHTGEAISDLLSDKELEDFYDAVEQSRRAVGE